MRTGDFDMNSVLADLESLAFAGPSAVKTQPTSATKKPSIPRKYMLL